MKLIQRILADTVRKWRTDKVPSLGAALAFYSVLSIGPLLLIVISIAGIIFGQEAASGHLFTQISGLVGNEGAQMIQTVLANSKSKTTGFLAGMTGVISLILSASALFGQLQDTLNIIWDVKARTRGKFLRILRKRFLSFTMVLGIGFLLLVSLIISTAIAAFSDYMNDALPEIMIQAVNFSLSFAVTILLFAMIFKILPDADIHWSDVWVGAALTALLFSIGRQLIGLYLGHSALSSTYGAAGSLIVILVWVYYSAQIVFLGAEFTQVYSRYFGSSRIKTCPADRA